jgi:hypothetical protein
MTYASRVLKASTTTRDAVAVPKRDQPPVRHTHDLERSLGNREVGRLLQAKLQVSAPEDAHEHEADRVAKDVVTLPIPMAPPKTSDQEAGVVSPFRTITESTAGRGASAVGHAEVDDDIAAKIEQSIGRGSPLPHHHRSFLEPRFGADFSNVRIHTSQLSNELNAALSAEAFTVGSDIFYGSGKSPSDLQLTAHELTHVVQQGGAGAASSVEDRDIQPSDERTRSAPRPPDRAPGRGDAPGGPFPSLIGLQRAAGNKALPALVQRYKENAKVNNMGSGSGPSDVTLEYIRAEVKSFSGGAGGVTASTSYLNFDSGLVETVTLGEDAASGTIKFHLFESTVVNNNLLNDRQWGSWDGTVPFWISGETITFGPAIVSSDVGGSGATLSVSPSSAGSPGGGLATFTAVVAAAGSGTTGGSAGIGPISASAPVSSTSNFAGGLARTFTVNLRTTKPKPITGPDMSFRVGFATLEDGQEGVVANWFRGLPPATQDAIRNGRRSITISGYASRTAKRQRNRDLSEQRAHVVERILRGFAGSSANDEHLLFRRGQRDDAGRGRGRQVAADHHRATATVGDGPRGPGPRRTVTP